MRDPHKLTSKALSMFEAAKAGLTAANEQFADLADRHRGKAAEHRMVATDHEIAAVAVGKKIADNNAVIDKLSDFLQPAA